MTTQVTMIFTGVPGMVTDAVTELAFRPDRIAVSVENFAQDTHKVVIAAESLTDVVGALLVIFPDPNLDVNGLPADANYVRAWLAGHEHGQRTARELAASGDAVPAVDREDTTPVPYGWGSTDAVPTREEILAAADRGELPIVNLSDFEPTNEGNRDASDYRIITFGPDHKHPITDESLAGKYVKLPGNGERARELALLLFGRGWSHQYRSEILSPIDKYGLKPISPAPRFDERGYWRGWEEA